MKPFYAMTIVCALGFSGAVHAEKLDKHEVLDASSARGFVSAVSTGLQGSAALSPSAGSLGARAVSDEPGGGGSGACSSSFARTADHDQPSYVDLAQ